MSDWVTSRYNFCVPVESGVLLFNAHTGALLRFNGPDSSELAEALCIGILQVDSAVLPPEMFEQLLQGGFLTSPEKDQLGEVKERFWSARGLAPLVLTITTTMDCNLGCYYCYEERSAAQLRLDDVADIVEVAKERLELSGKRWLHVDWYGGEPLLNLAFLEAASKALQDYCEQSGIRYQASIISNGTCWPDDVSAFIQQHRIRQVQISFDGLRQNHDRTRHYRADHTIPRVSSFDRSVDLVDHLLDSERVDIRFNLDRRNRVDLIPFLRFARARGWFRKPFPAVIQPARLSAYSAHSAFMRRYELTLEQYDELRSLARKELAGETLVEESESPDGFPHPRTSVCAALAPDSVVVGPERLLYRCGLQVGESHRSVGSLKRGGSPFPILGGPRSVDKEEALWWEKFDPTEIGTCRRCSFLPICWGGCPKRHLEKDAHALAEQGAYWRANLPRLIASGVGEAVNPAYCFSESEQFRGEG